MSVMIVLVTMNMMGVFVKVPLLDRLSRDQGEAPKIEKEGENEAREIHGELFSLLLFFSQRYQDLGYIYLLHPLRWLAWEPIIFSPLKNV